MTINSTKSEGEIELSRLINCADQLLADLMARGKDDGFVLDYSITSIRAIEKLLQASKDKPEIEKLKADAWLYIGQSICKSCGGSWKISNDLTNYRTHYLLPVVVGFSKSNIEYCPLIAVKLFLEQNDKSFFIEEILDLKVDRR